ncbi:unnamed protein product [Lota lota]
MGKQIAGSSRLGHRHFRIPTNTQEPKLRTQVCVSPSKADQIVSASLVPLEMAPESLPVPTSSSSPAAATAAGSGPEHGANLRPTRSNLTHGL